MKQSELLRAQHQVWAQGRFQVQGRVLVHIMDRVESQVQVQVWSQGRDQVMDQVWDQGLRQVRTQLIEDL